MPQRSPHKQEMSSSSSNSTSKRKAGRPAGSTTKKVMPRKPDLEDQGSQTSGDRYSSTHGLLYPQQLLETPGHVRQQEGKEESTVRVCLEDSLFFPSTQQHWWCQPRQGFQTYSHRGLLLALLLSNMPWGLQKLLRVKKQTMGSTVYRSPEVWLPWFSRSGFLGIDFHSG